MAEARVLLAEMDGLDQMLTNLGHTVSLAVAGAVPRQNLRFCRRQSANGRPTIPEGLSPCRGCADAQEARTKLIGALQLVEAFIEDARAKLDDVCTGLVLMNQGFEGAEAATPARSAESSSRASAKRSSAGA